MRRVAVRLHQRGSLLLLQVLQLVRGGEAATRSPLQPVRQVRDEDGSSLSMDRQLHRSAEPQEILAFPVLLSHGTLYDGLLFAPERK